MKKLIFILILLTFCVNETLSQKKINWGEDPVNLNYNGTPGMITIKLLYDTKASTQGRSGKWFTGIAGKGSIIDIDSVNFFSGKTISEGIGYACGNPVKFPDNINRSKILIVVKKISAEKTIKFVPCDSLQQIAGRLGLLQDELENLSEDIWQLNKKVENVQSSMNNSENSSFWSSPWPWVIVTVIVATIYILNLDQDNTEIQYVPTTPTGVGPGGKTGPIWKLVKIALSL